MTSKHLLLLALPFFLWNCASTPEEEFPKVQMGMEKTDVLELLGSPRKTRRWKGMDRWFYSFYTDHIEDVKEVHFKEGKVVYAGSPILTEQDKIDQISNMEELKEKARKKPDQESTFEELN